MVIIIKKKNNDIISERFRLVYYFTSRHRNIIPSSGIFLFRFVFLSGLYIFQLNGRCRKVKIIELENFYSFKLEPPERNDDDNNVVNILPAIKRKSVRV